MSAAGTGPTAGPGTGPETAADPRLGPDDVAAAAARIAGRVRRTPVVEVDGAVPATVADAVAKLPQVKHAKPLAF